MLDENSRTTTTTIIPYSEPFTIWLNSGFYDHERSNQSAFYFILFVLSRVCAFGNVIFFLVKLVCTRLAGEKE